MTCSMIRFTLFCFGSILKLSCSLFPLSVDHQHKKKIPWAKNIEKKVLSLVCMIIKNYLGWDVLWIVHMSYNIFLYCDLSSLNKVNRVLLESIPRYLFVCHATFTQQHIIHLMEISKANNTQIATTSSKGDAASFFIN